MFKCSNVQTLYDSKSIINIAKLTTTNFVAVKIPLEDIGGVGISFVPSVQFKGLHSLASISNEAESVSDVTET
jgi:hypothetical protein